MIYSVDVTIEAPVQGTEVADRVEAAVDRFESETDWDFGIGGSESPSKLDVARDLPKRGPAQLLGRLAFQSIRDGVSF